MKKKNIEIKEELKQIKGITLVALVITIVILIILATITINAAFGDGGLIEKAQSSKNMAEDAVEKEYNKMNSLMDEYSNIMAEDSNIPTEPNTNTTEEPSTNTVEEPEPEPETPTVDDAKNSGEKFEDTTEIKDDLENEVTIPGGFHIAEDSGTKVEEGIVIEDDAGNEFVWIPVGEYKVSTTINSTGKLTNNLSRRTFTSSGATEVNGDSAIKQDSYTSFYGREIVTRLLIVK